MRLLRDQILVEPIAGDATVRGIVIPERLRDKSATARGRVVSVGPGKRGEDGERQPMPVAPGDLVLFSAYCGVEVQVDGRDMLLFPVGDIFAVCESTP